MDLGENGQNVKEAIAKATGKSAQDIEALVSAKKEKFSGLLTEAGAAYMIAKELGVKAWQNEKEAKISELKPGMPNANVTAAIKQIFPPKEFDRNGRKGRLQSITLTDGTGEARATFWNTEIEKFSLLGLGRGDTIRFVNCSVSEYNGALQLNLSYNSQITRSEKAIELPGLRPKISGINDLDAGMSEVCVEVKIKKIFPEKQFENERGKGKVMNFIISEGPQEMRATAWGDMCEKVSEIEEGEKARIEGAYTKENRGEIELHLGRGAKIVKILN